MWLKNLIVYRLVQPFALPASEFEDKLAQHVLKPCSAIEMRSRGWVHASPAQRYVHTTNGQHLIALGVEEKLLPSSIIKQVAGERAAEIAQQQGFPVGRRQMRELREKVTTELRARALTRRRLTRAWIDPVNRWFVVDAAGGSRADELVQTLRDTLGSLPVEFVDTNQVPHSAMAAWIAQGEAPLGFTLDQDLELQSADRRKATVRYTRHTLEGKEVQNHVQAGKCVTRLGLTWRDRIAFVLTDKLQIKRVEFLDISKEKPDEITPEEQFDIDFTLMAGELSALLRDVVQALGGEAQAA